MHAVQCFLMLTFICINLKITSSMYCYWNTGCPYKYFSSSTPYNYIRGDIRDSRIRIKGCEPVSIWSILRHGKRRPNDERNKSMIQAISIKNDLIASHAAGKSSLCAQDVENLKNWKDNFNTYRHSTLAPEGYNEMKDLGQRLKEAFPELLGNLKESYYIIRPVWGPRTEDSAKGYIAGFNDSKLSYTKSTKEFDEMVPYLNCDKYEKQLRRSVVTYAEADKYRLNSDYLATKDRIQRRIGINYNLSDENVNALYDLCRYDSSGYDNKLSPWCAIFTSEDLKVFEYIKDLIHYYESGYGQKVAAKFGRLPLRNLLKSFKQAKEGKGKKLTSYITHGNMMEMVYTTLGLFKDNEPLTSRHRNPDRKWRPCKMSTFSSNLVAILNRCSSNNSDEFNVIVYVNEEPLLSICKDGVCTWQEFEEKFTFDDVSLDFCNLTSTDGAESQREF